MSQKQALLVDQVRVTVHYAEGHQLRGGPEKCTETPCFELKELAAELRGGNV